MQGYNYNYPGRSRGDGGNRGFRGRGSAPFRGRGRGIYHNNYNRDKSKRAPLVDANDKLMEAIQNRQDEKPKSDNMHGSKLMNHIITRNDRNYEKNKQFFNQKSDNKSLKITTNTYPLHFDNNLVVTEWDIINPKKTKNTNKLINIQKLYKNKQNISTLRRFFLSNYSDKESQILLTVHRKINPNNNNTDNQPKKASEINIYVDNICYLLQQKAEYHIQQFCQHMDQRREQIYQHLFIHHFFIQQQYIKREQAYFPKPAHTADTTAIALKHIDNICYIEGFKASIVHMIQAPHLGIKIWSKFIYLATETVRHHLKYKKGGDNNNSLIGAKAMVMYSMAVVEIHAIDTQQDERDGFEQNGIQISYRDYICKRYNMKAYDIKAEKYGLIIDKKNNRYLPQFLRVIIDNKSERAKSMGKKLNGMVRERIARRAELVDRLSVSSSGEIIFKIDKKPINTLGFILSDPRIEMNINGKNEIMNMREGMKSWRFLSGTIESKINNRKKVYKQWRIYIYGEEHRSNHKLQEHICKYINKRRFERFFERNITVLHDENELFGVDNKLGSDDRRIVVCIIRGNEDGSGEKRRLHAQFKQYGIKSQFIRQTTVFSAIKVFGCMDCVMFKIGESLYGIKSSHEYHNNLLLGFDVNHCTNRSVNRPSIGVMTAIRKYYVPKQNRIHGCVALLNKGQEQPSKLLSKAMVKNVLISQLLKTKDLPAVIWYFRDGIAESQFTKFNNTEIVGIKEAIEEVKNEEKLFKYFDRNVLEKWRPKMEIVVVQKRINDKFYAEEKMNINANTYIVPFDVVHAVKLDVYIAKGDHHPLRVIFVVDELQFRENDKIMECCQFLLDLLYCFPYGMPLGACSIPSPIKWSDKWAQTYQELIDSEKHTSIEDVSRFLNLAYIKPEESESRDLQLDIDRDRNKNSDRDRHRYRERSGSKHRKQSRSRSRSRNRRRDRNTNKKRSSCKDTMRSASPRDADKYRDRRDYKRDRNKNKSLSRSRSRSRSRTKRRIK